MNIGSKETELLIKLLTEFHSKPNSLSSLVQALRQKGYCKSLPTAYRYANRILAFRELFDSLKWTGRGTYILARVNSFMDNPSHSLTEKQQFIETEIRGLYEVLMTCAQHESNAPKTG